LAAHRNIAVRIFNPVVVPDRSLAFFGILLDLERLNRRMHNKTWIADDRLAIVGGRNLGDEYFDASNAVNFVDLDFAMFGPIVREASESFVAYWNSPAAHAVEGLAPDDVDARALDALRVELDVAAVAIWDSPYARALFADDAVRRLIAG